MSEDANVNEENTQVSIEDLQKQLDGERNAREEAFKEKEALRSKVNELLNETKRAKEVARERARAELQEEFEKAKKNGDYEHMFKSSEKEREALQNKLDKLQGDINNNKIDSAASAIASELADGKNVSILKRLLKDRLRASDDGLQVLDANGSPTHYSLDDLKNEVQSSGDYETLLRGNKSSGGGAAGGGSSAPVKNEMKKSAFAKLSAAEQHKFILKDGGKVIND